MRAFRKGAAWLLVLTLLLCVLPGSLPVRAESAPSYARYTVLGDSIPAGYGPYNYEYKGYAKIPGTYPALVADRAAGEMIPLARTGFRTQELRYMLEDDYTGDGYMFRIGKTSVEDVYLHRPEYRRSIASSDLITLEIGSNDIFNYGMVRAIDAMNDPVLTGKIQELLDETGDYGQAFSQALKIFGTVESVTGIVTGFVQGMYEGYAEFMKNWEAILSDIDELAPDATVVVVGMYNPLKTTKLTDADLIPIGQAFEVISAGMNQFMRYGSRYASRYTFVDISDTEIYDLPGLVGGMYMDMLLGMVHPTEAGHREIANRILKALPGEYDPVEAPEERTLSPRLIGGDDHTAYVSGYPDGTFRPQRGATRAEMASMLCGLMNEADRSVSGSPSFPDVREHWAKQAVAVMAKQGLMAGYKDGSFRPDRLLTRAEAVTVLTALFDDPGASGSSFSDMTGHWAAGAVDKAVKLGIAAGFADGTFRPDAAVTRAQLVTMINAAMGRDPDKKSIEHFLEEDVFSDVSLEAWYYHDVMEAAVSHDQRPNKDVEMWTGLQ